MWFCWVNKEFRAALYGCITHLYFNWQKLFKPLPNKHVSLHLENKGIYFIVMLFCNTPRLYKKKCGHCTLPYCDFVNTSVVQFWQHNVFVFANWNAGLRFVSSILKIEHFFSLNNRNEVGWFNWIIYQRVGQHAHKPAEPLLIQFSV